MGESPATLHCSRLCDDCVINHFGRQKQPESRYRDSRCTQYSNLPKKRVQRRSEPNSRLGIYNFGAHYSTALHRVVAAGQQSAKDLVGCSAWVVVVFFSLSNNRHVKLFMHADTSGLRTVSALGNVWSVTQLSRHTRMIDDNLGFAARMSRRMFWLEDQPIFVIGCETRNESRSCSRINNGRVSSFNIPAAIKCLKVRPGVPCGKGGDLVMRFAWLSGWLSRGAGMASQT